MLHLPLPLLFSILPLPISCSISLRLLLHLPLRLVLPLPLGASSPLPPSLSPNLVQPTAPALHIFPGRCSALQVLRMDSGWSRSEEKLCRWASKLAQWEVADVANSTMVGVIELDSEKVQLLCDAANEEVDEKNKDQIANFLCPEDFFIILHDTLAEREQVTELQPVPDAHVPVMKFKFYRISVDLLYGSGYSCSSWSMISRLFVISFV
ncbi:uncharacterized protein LOC131218040 [Magnolia sinica]|uniref:uncharacterized protein LOC131218040 n=1 Tax=Magnolia sinica TaxID=86752 RepID=UPI002658ADE9|nr:uncharacterized protein LOC131218040 [Magnolia sinica]